MAKNYRKPITFLLILIIAGQILFAIVSPKYTVPRYENRFYATIGIEFEGQDLHKLNEGAHYFGQTIIGWTKFPSFKHQLVKDLELPAGSDINMHMQERQNIVFSLITPEPLGYDQLVMAREYLQTQMDEYNEQTNTKFVLTNVDYEQAEVSRTYAFGAVFTLLLSFVAGLAILFVRKEFFPPKLKL